MTLATALLRCIRWLEKDAPDEVSSRILGRRCGPWDLSGQKLSAPAKDTAQLDAWLSPARRILYVRLREPGDASAELRVKLPRGLVREISA